MNGQYMREQYVLQTEQENNFNKLSDAYTDQLRTAILTGDRKAMERALHTIRHSELEHYVAGNLSVARLYVAGFMMLLKERVQEDGLPSFIGAEQLKNSYHALTQASMADQIQKITVDFCEALYREMSKYSYREYSSLVKLAVERIHLDKMKPISAGDIAGILKADRTYLAKVFHKETGKTMTEYIHSVKCDQAESMILSRHYSLHEVSDLLGYESYSYFSKVFKKYRGKLPSQV